MYLWLVSEWPSGRLQVFPWMLRWPHSSGAGATLAAGSGDTALVAAFAVDFARDFGGRVVAGLLAGVAGFVAAFAAGRVPDAACAASYRATFIARWASSLLMGARVEDREKSGTHQGVPRCVAGPSRAMLEEFQRINPHDLTERSRHTVTDIHDSFSRQGLVRPRDGRVLAGVCAGLGRRFGLDPWPARLLFVLVLMVLPGSQLIVYPILWILMPLEAPAPGSVAGYQQGSAAR